VGVKFINTDGMAFIGPGSEWFWTALSGIVLAVTFLAIYRQLSLQRSAGAIEQLNRIEQEYQSERMLRVALELAQARQAGIDPTLLPQVAVVALVNFWERVATLARRGHIDLELLWEGGSGFYCQGDWVRLLPWIEQKRTEDENPLLAEHFEWLVGEITARARRLGVRLDDTARQAARLDQSIAALRGSIQVEEALRR
jgi:hypothetical protein